MYRLNRTPPLRPAPAPLAHAQKIIDAGRLSDGRERVLLVGAALKSQQQRAAKAGSAVLGIDESLEELGRLADTAGLRVGGD
jgi:hypothetical protein